MSGASGQINQGSPLVRNPTQEKNMPESKKFITTSGIELKETYHPEDLVFLPWFSRQSPSSSVKHWYTFLNTFSSAPAVCH